MSQMIDGKLFFNAVDQFQFGKSHDSGIADQAIQWSAQRAYVFGTGHHGIPVGEIQKNGRCVTRNTGAGLICLGLGAGNSDNVCATHRQYTHGFVAQPRIGTGYCNCLAREIESLGHIFCGGVFAEATAWGRVANHIGKQAARQCRQDAQYSHALE